MASDYGRVLFENLIRVVNKFGRLNQIPRDFGVGVPLSPAEVHAIDAIGSNPGIHVTEAAQAKGVTPGAISQIISKLEEKSLILRYKDPNNQKSVRLKLTTKGEIAFHQFQAFKLEILAGFWEVFDEKLNAEQVALLLRFGKALEAYVDSLLTVKRPVLREYQKRLPKRKKQQ
jgi:DNA-binding MarR family transcriptional regulator